MLIYFSCSKLIFIFCRRLDFSCSKCRLLAVLNVDRIGTPGLVELYGQRVETTERR